MPQKMRAVAQQTRWRARFPGLLIVVVVGMSLTREVVVCAILGPVVKFRSRSVAPTKPLKGVVQGIGKYTANVTVTLPDSRLAAASLHISQASLNRIESLKKTFHKGQEITVYARPGEGGGGGQRVTCIPPSPVLMAEDLPDWKELQYSATILKGRVTRARRGEDFVCLQAVHPDTGAVAEGRIYRKRLPRKAGKGQVLNVRVADAYEAEGQPGVGRLRFRFAPSLLPEDLPHWRDVKESGTMLRGEVTWMDHEMAILRVNHPDSGAVVEGRLDVRSNKNRIQPGQELDVTVQAILERPPCDLKFQLAKPTEQRKLTQHDT